MAVMWRLTLLLLILGFASCGIKRSGMATLYSKKVEGTSYGYIERETETGTWNLAFGGNGYTSRESAQTYWLYRAAELTLERGYDGFEIPGWFSWVHRDVPISPEVSRLRPYQIAAGMIFIPIPTGQGNGLSYRPLTFPKIEADIRLIYAPITTKPSKIFDARKLKAAVEPYVVGPKCDVLEGIDNVCPHVHDYVYDP